jgi:histidinol-phosphate aminotransferase
MPDVDLGSLLNRIRASVRAQRPYVVGSIPDLRVKLNQNESPYDLPVELKRELQSKLLSIPFNRYPREQPERLRDVLSRHLDVPRESILVGNGSNELTHTLCLCMVEHQTPVVLPRPMFALFESAVRLFGGHPVTVPPTDDLRFDVTGICDAIAAHDPPLTVIATPNNPTGLEMTPEEQQQVVEASQGFVLIDEAYYDFASNPVGLDLLRRFQNVLVMRTFSKSWGLAGLRIGFIVGHPDVISALYRSRLPFMVG